MYELADPLLRATLLDNQHSSAKSMRADHLLRYAWRHLPLTHVGHGRMLLSLARHADNEATVDSVRRSLAWWVGMDQVGPLNEGLSDALQDGSLKPESLRTAISTTRQTWPAYRRAALLDAYAGQSDGIPGERVAAFHFFRAEVLQDLDGLREAHFDAHVAVRAWRDGPTRVPPATSWPWSSGTSVSSTRSDSRLSRHSTSTSPPADPTTTASAPPAASWRQSCNIGEHRAAREQADSALQILEGEAAPSQAASSQRD